MTDFIAVKEPAQQQIIDWPEECDFLPAEAIEPDSDPLASMTVADPFWRQRHPDSYDATVTKSAIILAWGKRRIGSVEAFEALMAHDLLDLDTVMWMVAQQHNCAKIIEGE